MEETIMNQDEIVEETAMVPVTETEIETIDNDVVDSADETYVSGYAVLAVGALIGVGIKIAYDKVGKPAIGKIKAKIAMTKAAHEAKEKTTKAKKAKADAVEVEEIHETDDDIQAED